MEHIDTHANTFACLCSLAHWRIVARLTSSAWVIYSVRHWPLEETLLERDCESDVGILSTWLAKPFPCMGNSRYRVAQNKYCNQPWKVCEVGAKIEFLQLPATGKDYSLKTSCYSTHWLKQESSDLEWSIHERAMATSTLRRQNGNVSQPSNVLYLHYFIVYVLSTQWTNIFPNKQSTEQQSALFVKKLLAVSVSL